MLNKKRRIRKRDQLRSLLTEVLPNETPVIFSNDGFYLRAGAVNKASPSLRDRFLLKLIGGEDLYGQKKRWYEPYIYKIRKGAMSFRTLSVVHPGAQWQFRQFYEDLHPLILHYTSGSSFSVRAPRRVAKTYYVKSVVSDLAKYKKSPVADSETEFFLRHSPSFFSYKGYARLYKFLDSGEILDLEAQFPSLWMLDISRCFDSIYTHSIGWATKSKKFTKELIGKYTFGDVFDGVMQSANQGETNGIVIGPEISRLFAEIILQEVDGRVERRLLDECKLTAGVDYAIRRYVDDYFVFGGEANVSRVAEIISSELWTFKLGINEAKVRRYVRPFLTEKSKIILSSSAILNDFTAKFSEVEGEGYGRRLRPLEIYRVERLALSFCNDVKLCCAENECGYDEVAGYLIAALKNRASLLMNHDEEQVAKIGGVRFADALCLLIMAVFFLYTVAPSVTSAYKLCTLIIMVSRFSESKLRDHAERVKSLIFAKALDSLLMLGSREEIASFINLEAQCLLLGISDLGVDYLVPPDLLFKIFCDNQAGESYFSLISLMYYVKNYDLYSTPRKWVIDVVGSKMKDLSSVDKNCEKALIAFDFIGCPYVSTQTREKWLDSLAKALSINGLTPTEVSSMVADFEADSWFVNWNEIDMLNLLERKELHAVY